MKHWYTTITTGQDDGGCYTVCTQKFFIDQDRFLFDLSGAFVNAGIDIDVPARVYIVRHSTPMTMNAHFALVVRRSISSHSSGCVRQ